MAIAPRPLRGFWWCCLRLSPSNLSRGDGETERGTKIGSRFRPLARLLPTATMKLPETDQAPTAFCKECESKIDPRRVRWTIKMHNIVPKYCSKCSFIRRCERNTTNKKTCKRS